MGQRKTVYLPHEEFRLLSQMNLIACEGIHNILYFRFFKKLNFPEKYTTWLTCTLNSYFYISVSRWCMLFGTYSEPTHYRELLKSPIISLKLKEKTTDEITEVDLRSYLLTRANIQKDDYETYHQKMLNYRNTFSIHRYHSPEKIKEGDIVHPELETAKSSFLSITSILLEVLNTFPQNSDSVNNSKYVYDDFSPQEIIDSINNNLPGFLMNIVK